MKAMKWKPPSRSSSSAVRFLPFFAVASLWRRRSAFSMSIFLRILSVGLYSKEGWDAAWATETPNIVRYDETLLT